MSEQGTGSCFGVEVLNLGEICYTYPGASRPALDRVTLTLHPGEALAVMGANGSGKSTLARVLAGLLKPQSGEVEISSEEPQPIPVGLLFQNPDNQMVAVTVEKEIAFAPENLNWSAEEMARGIDATLESFGIETLRNRLTAELSGGEKQRTALAAIMVFRPPVLVLDEPDSFLDLPGRELLRTELKRIRNACPHMIEVRITQYASVARQYDRLVVMDEGRVVCDGDPAEILPPTDSCVYRAVDGPAIQLATPETGDEPPPTALTAERISFGYSQDRILFEDLDLRVNAGETLAVVGPSASGKSTLGHLLCGLLKPLGGEVKFLDGTGKPPLITGSRGLVTHVFQQPERQFFLPTCGEELAFAPNNLGRPTSAAIRDSLLEAVGLAPERFRDRDPYSLSGGEKRRLAFAVALSVGPRFMIFDEPTCALDTSGVTMFANLSRRLRDSGLGQVIITHDSPLVAALADRVLVLGDGGPRLLAPSAYVNQSEDDQESE